MNWATVAQLIISVGLPMAEKIWQKWAAGGDPTQADWDELRAMAQVTPRTQLLAAAARAGLTDKDPKVVALLDELKKAGL